MADAKLSVQQKAALAKNTKEFTAGGIIFNEGDRSTEMYLLLRGKVAVIKGGNKIAEIDEPMTYFGEMGALLGEPRTATIQAIENCEFMLVPGDKIDQLIDVSPAVGKKLIQLFAQRLKKMNEERVALIAEATKARDRAQQQVAAAASDYKRVLYALALVAEHTKLPQVAELLKWGKDSSVLAGYGGRVDLDDRFFTSSPMLAKLHQLSKNMR